MFFQGSGASEAGPDGRHKAAQRLADALSVARVGASYVVSVAVSASDPARAAQIANALTEAYITDRVEARLESAQRTNIEQERQRELRSRILSSAVPPLSASSPRRRIILAVAAVFGAFFGLGIAFLRRAMDDTVRSPEQVASTGARLLAAVPATRFGKDESNKVTVTPPEFEHARLNPRGPFAQSVRKISRAVQTAKPRPGHGVCLGILSMMPGEGASTVAHNVADLLGTSGRRTLLVEFDVRRVDHEDPRRNDSALNYSFLTGARLRAALLSVKGQGSSDDLSAGPEELLVSKRMEKFLSQCQRDYEYVLVDCPASDLLPGAIALTRCLDALVVVVEWGRLPFDLFATSVSSLGVGSPKLLGVVLNKCPVDLFAAQVSSSGGRPSKFLGMMLNKCRGLPATFANRLKRRS
jgi:Mrp family chromosome partitioning ATPase